MKRIYFYFKIVILAEFMLLTACVSAPPLSESLYNQKPASYSYIIGDAKTGNITSQYNADTYITPASCQKLVTTVLAYKVLGKDYHYETKLYRDAKDLNIIFSGDPTLTSEQLIAALKPLEGQNFKGKIILDGSLFNIAEYSNSLMRDDVGSSYSAPVSAIILDANYVNVTIGASQLGGKAKIINDSGYIIDNDITTTEAESQIALSWQEGHIKASGHININDLALKQSIAPLELKPHLLKKIQQIMTQLSIKASAIVINSTAKNLAAGMKLLTTITSKSLGEIIPPALKISDNLVYDSLYLKIIHLPNNLKAAPIKDWQDGHEIIKNLLSKYAIFDAEKALIIDGSGLSRYGRLQTKQLFALLRYGYNMPEFIASLPSTGEKLTTLENRSHLSANIRAKTGNIAGITCLAGYGLNESDGDKIFVITANNFAPPLSEMISIIDRFASSQVGEKPVKNIYDKFE